MLIKKFPIIDIGDYILREHQDKDVDHFYKYYTDNEVSKYILAEIPKTLDEARRELYYWKNIFYGGSGIYFSIADKRTDEMVGSIGLTTYSSYNNRIEISYDLSRKYWRRGIAEKSIRSVIAYTFNILKINRIEAITSVYNEPSIRLLEKVGFLYEGCLRQHRYHLGNFVDVYSFSILRNEFSNFNI